MISLQGIKVLLYMVHQYMMSDLRSAVISRIDQILIMYFKYISTFGTPSLLGSLGSHFMVCAMRRGHGDEKVPPHSRLGSLGSHAMVCAMCRAHDDEKVPPHSRTSPRLQQHAHHNINLESARRRPQQHILSDDIMADKALFEV